jgi:hypothetical protein
VLGTDRTFDYITIPILVRMNLFKGIYIAEGPSFHMLAAFISIGVS